MAIYLNVLEGNLTKGNLFLSKVLNFKAKKKLSENEEIKARRHYFESRMQSNKCSQCILLMGAYKNREKTMFDQMRTNVKCLFIAVVVVDEATFKIIKM
jgi:hypothetical protein